VTRDGVETGAAAVDEAQKLRCTVVEGDGSAEFVVRPERPLIDSVPHHVRAPIQIGCRGGGCGVCRVQVLEGGYRTGPMSRRFVTPDDEATRFALACKLYATTDIVVRWAPVQPRTAATD
jgi:ferredoxin